MQIYDTCKESSSSPSGPQGPNGGFWLLYCMSLSMHLLWRIPFRCLLASRAVIIPFTRLLRRSKEPSVSLWCWGLF